MTDGRLVFLWDDRLRGLCEQGRSRVSRASHVEPYDGDAGCWMVDFAPIAGPATVGFTSRAEALSHELDFLSTEFGSELLKAAGRALA